MRSHLFSLHPSIWEIVENGMKFDSSDSPMFINEQIHKNAQATTVLLASLCRDEYNKVSGLDNAKQIWDTLKISHEGNDVTMLTKMELVEGELGRFALYQLHLGEHGDVVPLMRDLEGVPDLLGIIQAAHLMILFPAQGC